MMKFIIRRLLYMIPIVLGVIMLNFVLFNIAGGSAASSAYKLSVRSRCSSSSRFALRSCS